jgi:hypothetical protein
MPSHVLWKLDPYHELRTNLFGDPQKDQLKLKLIHQESSINFPTNEKITNHFREKWKFRATGISENTGHALVEDVDKDGIPDVFIGSGSITVYRLNGINGEPVWKYALPFGLTSTLGYLLADLDNDGMKEFIFGNTLSHPIRVYALRTGRNEKNRVYWKRNVSGDFFQAGLSSFRNSNGEIRIVAATRDAPYSRGSLNILDGFGERVVQEITGFDVCNNRPTFLDANKDGELDILIGSMDMYGVKYGEKLTAIDSITGRIIWSVPMERATGDLNFPILDINSDGENEIIVPSHSKFLIYTPSGHQKGEINGGSRNIATFPNSGGDMTLLYNNTENLFQMLPRKLRVDLLKLYRKSPIFLDVLVREFETKVFSKNLKGTSKNRVKSGWMN